MSRCGPIQEEMLGLSNKHSDSCDKFVVHFSFVASNAITDVDVRVIFSIWKSSGNRKRMDNVCMWSSFL